MALRPGKAFGSELRVGTGYSGKGVSLPGKWRAAPVVKDMARSAHIGHMARSACVAVSDLRSRVKEQSGSAYAGRLGRSGAGLGLAHRVEVSVAVVGSCVGAV